MRDKFSGSFAQFLLNTLKKIVANLASFLRGSRLVPMSLNMAVRKYYQQKGSTALRNGQRQSTAIQELASGQ